jgi:ribosomal protein S12 methylthiotransferase accessory factor
MKRDLAQPIHVWAMPTAVLESLRDKARVSPTLAGQALIDGSQLTVRLPEGDVAVQARPLLLKQVFKWCDGNRTWEDILKRIPTKQREEFDQFVSFLLSNRALVDANMLTAVAAGWGQQTIAVGVAGHALITTQIAQRFNGQIAASKDAGTVVAPCALDGLLKQRVSTYTFADAPVSKESLHTLLWTLGGIVQANHPRTGGFAPHRTIGSGGGMYLVRWYVALVRTVGEYAPGVYLVDYRGERQVKLTLVNNDVALFHRCFLHPWHQTYATGGVFGISDVQIGSLRYRNRALQYQYLEAGAALQNFSLTAPSLGVASSIIGGYSEDHVMRLCSVDGEFSSGHELVLAAAIFGATPSAQQKDLQLRMMPIDFIWSNAEGGPYELPFHLARARLKDKDETEYNTWGKDADPWVAFVKAHVETIERQGMREPRHITVSKIADLTNPIDPRKVVCYAQAQYRLSNFRHRPFDSAETYHWVPATDIDSGIIHQVLGEFVYGGALNGIKISGASYTAMNSSGCAAGRTRDDAILAALLEVLERDAFMRHWFAQQPGLRLPPNLLPRELQQRVRTMEQAGCVVTLQKLQSAAAEVVLASATHDAMHFTCVAAAAKLDIALAAQGALDELDTMVYTRLIGEEFTPISPRNVATPADHALLYAQKPYYRKAGAVLQPLLTYAGQTEHSLHGLAPLEYLKRALAEKNLQALCVDITPDRSFIDQGRTPISVVKAIVPTLIPISFGYAREPRGMVPFVHSASFFPHPFP